MTSCVVSCSVCGSVHETEQPQPSAVDRATSLCGLQRPRKARCKQSHQQSDNVNNTLSFVQVYLLGSNVHEHVTWQHERDQDSF
jgi:hypothetical protein